MSETPQKPADLYPPERIVSAVESALGKQVDKITQPGGYKRAVYRVFTGRETFIAVHREDPARADKERLVMETLSPHTDAVPAYLGMVDGLILQSDAGAERLNRRIYQIPKSARLGLAATAVQKIWDMHVAARKTDLHETVPPLLSDPDDVARFVSGTDRLAFMVGAEDAPEIDVEALIAAITPSRPQFVKWDCRAGNGAIDGDDDVRWFDFEYAGTRHGAEDFAWLAADEVWPISAADMRNLVSEGARRHYPNPAAFMRVFNIYATLQAGLRLRVILRDAHKRGWINQLNALRYDYVGTDPYIGKRLSQKATDYAAQDPLTQPMIPVFDAAAAFFQTVIDDAARRKAEASD